MDGFVTIATNDAYLQRAVMLALSAKRFGFPTLLLYKSFDPSRYAEHFFEVVDIGSEHLDNDLGGVAGSVGELKRHCYKYSSAFSRCAYADSDSLVIRHPVEIFELPDPVHTPGGKSISGDMRWGVPPVVESTVKLARDLGVNNPLQTLNGGFLVWKRGERAEQWFKDFGNFFANVLGVYRRHGAYRARDELCMALAFAKHSIRLSKSDSSIGIWDAQNLQLDIDRQIFQCVKGYYWEGHRFEPRIAHFGGSRISDVYRRCVQYLRQNYPVNVPLFNQTLKQKPPVDPLKDKGFSISPSRRSSPARHYDFSHWEKLPKVSCQCITFGRPELLNEAVESFLRQDYPGELELVILNDCRDVVLENPGISGVHVFNVDRRFRTVGEKRNACCGLCSGDVIFPWDDDDISFPWRISYSIEQMTNRHYFKPDRLWYWGNDHISEDKPVAHAMGAWSKELFDQVGGYPHIQSGQDQALEDLFAKTGHRDVKEIEPRDNFYLYRFPGTGSYHLSAHGFGKGYTAAEEFVRQKIKPGTYSITPMWRQNYPTLVPQK